MKTWLFLSRQVVFDSLQLHGLQCTRLPCPSSSPAGCSDSCPLLVMVSSHLIFCYPLFLYSFPTSRSFPVRQLFPSGGQSSRASASASVLLMNIQGRLPLGLTGSVSCSCLTIWFMTQDTVYPGECLGHLSRMYILSLLD